MSIELKLEQPGEFLSIKAAVFVSLLTIACPMVSTLSRHLRFILLLLSFFCQLSALSLAARAEGSSVPKPIELPAPPAAQTTGDETPALRGLDQTGTQSNAAAPIQSNPDSTQTTYRSGRKVQPILLHTTVSTISQPISLSSAVQFADDNYPAILRSLAQLRASKENITVQKLNEYLPESLFQMQEVMASRNKITEIFYGSPVFPASSGPGFPSNNMQPRFFSGAGVNLDWAPLDFGLHKARIQLAKDQYGLMHAQYGVTKLDIEVAAAAAFLDVVEAYNNVTAVEENVRSFEEFANIVNAQVKADLKPGADASLAEAQLANAQNQLFRAKLNLQVAKADFANALGVAGTEVPINDTGIVEVSEPATVQNNRPVFEQVPILDAARYAIITAVAQRKVLDKEYWPVFHWLGGFQVRGSAVNTAGDTTWQDAAGLAPVVPNYQVALIINWNFLDWFRLHAEKKVQDQRIAAEQYGYNLVLNNLKTEDIKSRAQVITALEVAKNMPLQVSAARDAVKQARARYSVGLSSVAQVAEANQLLAQSLMQMAVARVGVWRAMLTVSSVHGDLGPFMAEANRVQQSNSAPRPNLPVNP
ncbi:MAG TPA: TolC family protein [Planktothrix sp.]